MARILAGRGIDSTESLVYDLRKAISIKKLTNAERMAQLIADKMEKGQRFLIVADYDSDGATSCAIGMRAMKGFGADIDFMVPNRFIQGMALPRILSKRWRNGTRAPIALSRWTMVLRAWKVLPKPTSMAFRC